MLVLIFYCLFLIIINIGLWIRLKHLGGFSKKWTIVIMIFVDIILILLLVYSFLRKKVLII